MPIMAVFNHAVREVIVLLLAIYAYMIANNEQQVILYSIIFMIYACVSNVCYNIWLSNVMTSVGRDKQVIYFAKAFKRTQYIGKGIESDLGSAEAVQEHVQKKFNLTVYANFFLISIVIFNILKAFLFS